MDLVSLAEKAKILLIEFHTVIRANNSTHCQQIKRNEEG